MFPARSTVCLLNRSNQQAKLPSVELWRDSDSLDLIDWTSFFYWLYNRSSAAHMGSLTGFTAAVWHVLQTWDRRMLSLNYEPICLYAMLISNSRGVHGHKPLNSSIRHLQQLLFATAFAHSLRLSPQDTTYHFHTENNTAYAEYMNFAGAAAARLFQLWLCGNPCGSVWIRLLSLISSSLINWYLLQWVYIQPADVFCRPSGNSVWTVKCAPSSVDGACPDQFVTVRTAVAPRHTVGSLVATRKCRLIIYFHS